MDREKENKADDEQLPEVLSARSDEIIWAEANLLRLPFFALSTKNLAKIDVRTIAGEVNDGPRQLEFNFKVSRNVEHPFPGPLSRRVHFALLALLAEQGYKNPVEWSWGKLCDRLGLPEGGSYVQKLKDAILATRRASISSRFAIYLKSSGEWIQKQKDASLYQDVEFFERAKGEKIGFDHNRLWFADWYLENITLFHARKVNLKLWRELDEQSTIASRLYEMLLYKWTRGPIALNYSTLVNYLPVTPIPYRSHAMRQLEKPLCLVNEAGILSGHQWEKSKTDEIGKVILRRGAVLRGAESDETLPAPFPIETLRVQTTEKTISPAERLVSQFYAEWLQNPDARPVRGDIDFARKMIEDHGEKKAESVVEAVIPILRTNYKKAKTLQAIELYIPEALKASNQAEARATRQQQEQQQMDAEKERGSQLRDKRARAKVLWESLSESEQQEIKNRVIANKPEAERFGLFTFCLDDLMARMT
jgi:hypothetical protein